MDHVVPVLVDFLVQFLQITFHSDFFPSPFHLNVLDYECFLHGTILCMYVCVAGESCLFLLLRAACVQNESPVRTAKLYTKI